MQTSTNTTQHIDIQPIRDFNEILDTLNQRKAVHVKTRGVSILEMAIKKYCKFEVKIEPVDHEISIIEPTFLR